MKFAQYESRAATSPKDGLVSFQAHKLLLELATCKSIGPCYKEAILLVPPTTTKGYGKETKSINR
jgi:hypothetical protein